MRKRICSIKTELVSSSNSRTRNVLQKQHTKCLQRPTKHRESCQFIDDNKFQYKPTTSSGL